MRSGSASNRYVRSLFCFRGMGCLGLRSHPPWLGGEDATLPWQKLQPVNAGQPASAMLHHSRKRPEWPAVSHTKQPWSYTSALPLTPTIGGRFEDGGGIRRNLRKSHAPRRTCAVCARAGGVWCIPTLRIAAQRRCGIQHFPDDHQNANLPPTTGLFLQPAHAGWGDLRAALREHRER